MSISMIGVHLEPLKSMTLVHSVLILGSMLVFEHTNLAYEDTTSVINLSEHWFKWSS